jgi:hypothetical protein
MGAQLCAVHGEGRVVPACRFYTHMQTSLRGKIASKHIHQYWADSPGRVVELGPEVFVSQHVECTHSVVSMEGINGVRVGSVIAAEHDALGNKHATTSAARKQTNKQTNAHDLHGVLDHRLGEVKLMV